ncbi:MAG: hypothetical protein CM15mP44_2440 [Candidatus Neomarinimicrobiota bacterium]|nr:MAG: hypothetical protein CM15mP44_2440 [Candidatus Neomarinimicrobiota bacterium]
MKKELSTNGFTMTELVVTVALMGTLLSLVAPKFTNVSEETQGNGILQICILFWRSFSLLLQINAEERLCCSFPS